MGPSSIQVSIIGLSLVSHAFVHDMIPNKTYSPQPPGAFRLIDVDEVGDHAALQQAALGLHADLKRPGRAHGDH